MPLSSLHFIFVFLPIFLVLFYILPFNTWRNSILVVASLVFFGWSDPGHLPLLIGMILLNYLFGRVIGYYLDNEKQASARPLMWVAVMVNLLVLIFYKYTGFVLQSVADIANLAIKYEAEALPLGISFFTFSGIAYILDIYNRTEKAEKNIIRFSSYLIMFPKLLQGPITRFGQIKEGLLKSKPVPNEVIEGVRRFIAGLAKKALLADPIGLGTDKIFNANFDALGAGAAWFGLIGYTLQIYLDFSGYTDMAIGLGKMIGLKLPENFNFPYISRSITDFWRRWHMTLTAWFRNYLFIPLEFARKREKFLRQQSNILIVFLLTGLWHGADWNFVIWGIYFGLILAIEASGLGKLLKKLPIFLQHFYAIALIMLGWVFFRVTAIENWGPFLKALLGGNGWTTDITLRNLNVLFYIPIAIIGVVFCLPFINKFERKVSEKGGLPRLLFDILYLVLFILSVASILANGFTAFIYAQF
jgi:alginate O-acetyltransferase complex protein AlgI